MIAAYCTARRSAYNGPRGVENLLSGNRTRQTCGIFICTPCLDSVYGLEGREIFKYPPPFLSGFEPGNLAGDKLNWKGLTA